MKRRRATVYLGLGANLGDREQNIRAALRRLAGKVRIDRVSSLYESAPVGYADQPDFLNAACRGSTALAPEELLAFIKQIEADLGRVTSFRNAPRPIDIDILLYDDLVLDAPGLTIPHPRMAGRPFVLVPLAEIASRARHPVLGKTVQALLTGIAAADVRRAAPPPEIPPPSQIPPLGGEGFRERSWLEVRVTVSPELVEPLAELFVRQGRARVAIEENDPHATTAEAWEKGRVTPTTGPETRVTVRGYLPVTAAGRRRKARIEVGLKLLGMIVDLPPLEERVVRQEEWEAALRAHFPLLRVGRRLVLQPEWEDYHPGEGEAVVALDPGAAFGTGHHPTTRLCLEMLEHWVKPGNRVLDVGTGSGVLAVAALVLGAASAIALDTDPVAVRSTRRNARRNGLQRRVRVIQGSLPGMEHGLFDLVVANITARIVGGLLAGFRERLAPGGTIVVSGMLAEQRWQVAECVAPARLRILEEREYAGWLALALGAS